MKAWAIGLGLLASSWALSRLAASSPLKLYFLLAHALTNEQVVLAGCLALFACVWAAGRRVTARLGPPNAAVVVKAKKYLAFELSDLILYSLLLEKQLLTNVSEWAMEVTLVCLASSLHFLASLALDAESTRGDAPRNRRRTVLFLSLLGAALFVRKTLQPFTALQNGFFLEILGLNLTCTCLNLLLAAAQHWPCPRRARGALEVYTAIASKLIAIYRDCYKVLVFNLNALDPSVRIYLFKALTDAVQLLNYLLVLGDLTRIRRLRLADSELVSDRECSICLENIAEGVLTKCGHVFHYACLELLLKNNTNRKCPYCGQPLEFLDPHRPIQSRLRAWLGRIRDESLPSLLCFFHEKSRFFVAPPPSRMAFLH